MLFPYHFKNSYVISISLKNIYRNVAILETIHCNWLNHWNKPPWLCARSAFLPLSPACMIILCKVYIHCVHFSSPPPCLYYHIVQSIYSLCAFLFLLLFSSPLFAWFYYATVKPTVCIFLFSWRQICIFYFCTFRNYFSYLWIWYLK